MKTVATWILAAALWTPFLSLGYATLGHSDDAPPCMSGGSAIGINNNQVIQWESSTPNQFLARGHVSGPVVQVYPDQNGHHHFAIQIGSDSRLEVIYNEDFGSVPQMSEGMNVEACGDYITSTAQSAQYPASPDGAIIHWVHQSPNLAKHASGFLMVDGVLYGQDAENAGPQQ
jgi:hypothetical protein